MSREKFRPFEFLFVSGSVLASLLVVVVWVWSYQTQIFTNWSANSTLYSVHSGKGTVVCFRFHRYQFKPAQRWVWGTDEPETPRAYAAFKKDVPNYTEYSWWNRVGYDVEEMTRFARFEIVKGKWWPPFVWRHPRMRFTAVQLPYWAFLVLAATPGFVCALRWMKCRMQQEHVNRDAEATDELTKSA